MRSARDGDIGHAVVEQVFRAQLRVHMDQHPLGGLPLAGVAGHGITVVEMRMLLRIEVDTASALIHLQLNAPIVRNALDGSQLTVRNLQIVRLRGRCELSRSPTENASS